ALNFIRRDYGDMGNLIFVRNTSSEATNYQLFCGEADTKAYVLDARTGEIHETAIKNGVVSGSLAGLDSIAILFAEDSQFAASDLSAGDPLAAQETSDAAALDSWTLSVDGDDVKGYTASGDAALGLWRDNEALQYCADPGLYTTTFTLDSVDSTKDYILKLGTLYGVPEISVNGSEFEAVSMAPYELDITKYVKAGENTVTVKLIVPLRNRLIGYAANGEDGNGLNKEHYSQFAGKTLAKSGMTAPGSVVAVQTSREPVVDPGSSSENPDSSTSTPDSSSGSSDVNAPNTGDQAPVMMMAVLLLASGAAAFVLIRRRKEA
ncbi:MAG: LPXTG cell wall anchor domain-containing protein, partial [Clostridiales bacterium]|nr:LPXTG cell wall anchor domain-containing protein [Clostridiales bacterium]